MKKTLSISYCEWLSIALWTDSETSTKLTQLL